MKTKGNILLIEDDQVDVLTVKKALRQLDISHDLSVAENGEAALEFLNKDNPRPSIILLDLNMPRMNGLEFLDIAKKDQDLKSIPVIVLTTSMEEQDKLKSFELYIAGYMVKPVDYDQFVDVIRIINDYWQMSQLIEE